jgi:hypothetical protein
MNESFNLKRFLASFEPVNWKRQLLAVVFGILFLTIFYSVFIKTSEFIYAVVFFGLMHRSQFDIMSSQSGLSRFLLLPASNLEKYIALFTKAIVFPAFFVLIISIGTHLISMYFPNYSTNEVFRVDQFYVSILLFIILFCLRFVLRCNSYGVYFILYIVLMFPLMFAEKYIHLYFCSLVNYPIYHSLYYILLSIALLLFTYPQMKRLQISRIKEEVDTL